MSISFIVNNDDFINIYIKKLKLEQYRNNDVINGTYYNLMDAAAILEILKLSVQQNYALITGSFSGLFLFLLITGYLPNMLLNMLFVVGLLCDTIPTIAKKDEFDPVVLLKSWTILGTIIVLDYVISTIFDSTMVNVLLNVLKLVAFTTLYKYLPMIYDVYFAVFADKVSVFVNENIVKNIRTKSIKVDNNKKYDLLNYLKSFIWTQTEKKND